MVEKGKSEVCRSIVETIQVELLTNTWNIADSLGILFHIGAKATVAVPVQRRHNIMTDLLETKARKWLTAHSDRSSAGISRAFILFLLNDWMTLL